jgi:type II secretory pathway component PulK
MMVERCKILSNERGAVLITALLVLVLLTIIGIAATTTTTTDLQIAGNQKIHSMAFYAAEAGIEVGRELLNDLKKADSGNWDNLLAEQQLVGQADQTETLHEVIANAGGDRTVGSPRFSFDLEVRDNEDLDDNDNVDTDDIIVLISTGKYEPIPGLVMTQVQIETQVRYSGGGDQYAQEHYGTDSSGVATTESGTTAAQQRW